MTPPLMTREAFEAWLAERGIPVPPQQYITRCYCHDTNCHGWRLIPQLLQRAQP